ncbi:MAG TPA: hypothetical protein VN961_06370 [Streptosporangiaceae bacterium]|nr:hypothetical protein [Streptosporangiaceae bacterium]
MRQRVIGATLTVKPRRSRGCRAVGRKDGIGQVRGAVVARMGCIGAALPRLGPAADLAIADAISAANWGKIINGRVDNVTINTTGPTESSSTTSAAAPPSPTPRSRASRSGGLFKPTTTFNIVRGSGNSGF